MIAKAEKRKILDGLSEIGDVLYKDPRANVTGRVWDLHRYVKSLREAGSKKLIIVCGIFWDTDEEDREEAGLPDKLCIENPTEEMLEGERRADAISDYISDKYDRCVESFTCEVYEIRNP